MSTLLFVLLFVLLGLGTVLLAMRSGSRGPIFDPNKRSGRRAVAFLAALTVLLFGIAIPIATAVDGAEESKQAGPVELTANEERGRELFSPTCSQCHTLEASKAVGRVGPDLDELRPPRELVLDAILKGRYRGQGQMPDRLYDGQDARDVSAYVARVAGS
jgi:mono/diheme cytochrome c family protein